MRRRALFLGTIMVVAALVALSPPAAIGGAGAGDTAGAADAAEQPVDPAAVAAAVERQVGDRYGGYWVEREGDAEVVHLNVVEPTEADRRVAGEHGRIHDAAHSYDHLVASRDAVAGSLDRQQTGDFAVGVDVPGNAVTVETERGDAEATRLVSLAAIRELTGEGQGQGQDHGPAAVTPASAAEADVEVVSGSDIGVDLLSRTGETPTTFPPYEAGLHLAIASEGTNVYCTSGFAFAGLLGTYGSTAGHCAAPGETVRVGATAVGQVTINSFETATRVQGDTALYPLSANGWSRAPVVHGNPIHRRLVGSLSDRQIGNGLRLCFDGRTSGTGNCAPVIAANRVICCDFAGKSYVYSCIDRSALAGDSGGPVYQPRGGNEARAAGTLSSSVVIGGRRSMCFSTVDRIERATGTTIDLGGG